MKNIRLYYFHDMRNFGDALNPLLLERVFGIRTTLASIANADLIAIGSILDGLLGNGRNYLKYFLTRLKNRQPLYIYGSGFITGRNRSHKLGALKRELLTRNVKPCALRGEHTRNRLEKILNRPLTHIPLGDPGLLASCLLDDFKGSKQYAMAVIPSDVDKSDRRIADLAGRVKNSVIIDVTDDPMNILRQIARCETVVSTAMHGLIVADSLGIPNLWIKASDKIIGGSYKFMDYYSAFNIYDNMALDLNTYDVNKITPSMIYEGYRLNGALIAPIKCNLIKAFPQSFSN